MNKKIMVFGVAVFLMTEIGFAKSEKFKGVLTVIHSESFSSGRSETSYEFFGERKGRAAKKYRLNSVGKLPENLVTGAQVQVEGSADGNVLEASSLALISSSDTATSSSQEASSIGVGLQNTIVVLLNFQDSQQTCTKSQVDSLMFNSRSSVNKFYQENSYGKVGFQGVVTDPLTISAPTMSYCDLSSISENADLAATQAGFDLSKFQRRIYVLPPNSLACGWTGAAYIGGSRVFINNSGCANSMVYAHELGHSLGMNHASNSADEYGDHSDVMGAPSTMLHFNSVHKIAMGWIPSSRVVLMTSVSQDFVVAQLEQDMNEIQTVKVPISGTADSYYISYRRGIGFDANLNSGFFDSVSVHKAGLGTRSYLVGMVPDGGEWTDPTGAVKIRLSSRDSTYARVHVEVGTPDVIAPTVPTNLQATIQTVTSGKGRRAVVNTLARLSWTASVDDRSVQRYAIERNGVLYTIMPASNGSFDDSSVQRGVTYTYRIQAIDAAGNISAYSLPVVVTP